MIDQIPLHLPVPVGSLLPEFTSRIISIHPGLIEGIYLTGSLALGDFLPNKSDIDFLVICKRLPNLQEARKLRQIHHAFARKCPKPDFSGTYFSLDDLNADIPQNSDILSYHEGSLTYGKFEMAPVSLYELKYYSVAMYGPPADQLPYDISSEQLHRFLIHNLSSYWANWLRIHTSYLKRRMILYLFPRFTEWVVLGIARQLCTLQTGTIVSKTAAGYYCLDQLPQKFHAIVNEAISIRRDQRSYPLVRSYAIRPSHKRSHETIACARYLIELCNRTYMEKYP